MTSVTKKMSSHVSISRRHTRQWRHMCTSRITVLKCGLHFDTLVPKCACKINSDWIITITADVFSLARVNPMTCLYTRFHCGFYEGSVLEAWKVYSIETWYGKMYVNVRWWYVSANYRVSIRLWYVSDKGTSSCKMISMFDRVRSNKPFSRMRLLMSRLTNFDNFILIISLTLILSIIFLVDITHIA
jgi:hypothetical protein